MMSLSLSALPNLPPHTILPEIHTVPTSPASMWPRVQRARNWRPTPHRPLSLRPLDHENAPVAVSAAETGRRRAEFRSSLRASTDRDQALSSGSSGTTVRS